MNKRENTYKLQLEQKKYDFNFVKKCIEEILELDVDNKLVVSSCIVPYLILNLSSNREHENIDFLCELKDIEYLRDYFLNELNFKLLGDSLNNNKGDYGFVIEYKGVPVGIYPYYFEDGKVYEKNYYYYSNDQFIRVIKNINTSSFVFERDNIKYQSLEVIIKKKFQQNRSKDQRDIEILIKCGVDVEKAKQIEIEEID